VAQTDAQRHDRAASYNLDVGRSPVSDQYQLRTSRCRCPTQAISAAKLSGPANLQNCSDNGFQDKIAKKKVQINQTYVDSAGPVVELQLEKAGLRLSALLDALWTSVGQ